jgi:hypothetical protein
MNEYFLPRHIHFCFCNDDVVVYLDLEKDAYNLMDGRNAAALRTLASLASPEKPKFDIPDIEDNLRELLKFGVLTTNHDAGREPIPATSALATLELLDQNEFCKSTATLGHIINFIFSCTLAATHLRLGRISETVAAIERRKARSTSSKTINVDRARELTAVFNKLRIFFPRSYLCLFDSLALIEFLARYQVFPQWVFGVKLDPWGAHCWVQEEQFVFNDLVERTARYVPIMTI